MPQTIEDWGSFAVAIIAIGSIPLNIGMLIYLLRLDRAVRKSPQA